MMDLTARQTELETDPAAIGYGTALAAGDAGALRDLLNTPRAGQELTERVSRRTAQKVLIRYGCLKSIEESAAASTAAWNAWHVLNHFDFSEIDFSDPDALPILGALVGEGIVPAAAVATLQALGKRTVSRSEKVWRQAVSLDDLYAVFEVRSGG